MDRYFSRRNYDSDKAMFDDMMKYIRELEGRNQWISVKNQPEEESYVDLWVNDAGYSYRITDCKFKNGEFKQPFLDKDGDIDFYEVVDNATHYMLLPPAPKEEI